MKKMISLGVISVVVLSAFVPFTQATEGMNRRLVGSGITGSGRTVNLECASAAVATRETSILNAYQNLSNTLISELTVRAKSLASAWSMEDVSNRRVARESAWSTWKMNSKTARDEFRKNRLDAWNTYRASMKTCNVTSNEIENMLVQGSDVQ